MNKNKHESGQSVVEYILLMALMLVIAVAIMNGIRGKLGYFARGLAYRVAQPCADCQEATIAEPKP